MPANPATEMPVIVIADDSHADRKLAVTAFQQARLKNPIQEIHDGQELMDFLRRKGKFSDTPDTSAPLVILLDINMPRMSGLEALAEIKSDPTLRRTPVIMLTTSQAEMDVVQSYDLGVNSFITKPVGFPEFLAVVGKLGHYWLKLVEVPGSRGRQADH